MASDATIHAGGGGAMRAAKPASSGGVAPWAVAAGALVLVTFAAMFWPWFVIQHKLSSRHPEDWGHAYLVPLISGWLLWQKRAALSSAEKRVYPPGLLAVGFGVALFAYMTLGFYNHMAQGFAWILCVYGAVLFALGPAVARAAFVPLAYLVFAVTISGKIMAVLTGQLQVLASQGSWAMLSVIGALADFNVDISGVVLTIVTRRGGEVQEFPLNVAEACSGMRMVVAFFALSFAVALVACRRWWQRIATILLAAPVAILMNMIRVAVLGLLTLADPALAAGEAHTLIGTVLLVPSLGLFLGVVWALNRMVKPDAAAKPGVGSGPAVAASPRAVWVAAGSLALVLGGSAAAFRTAVAVSGAQLQKTPIYAPGGRTLLSLPTETASWSRVGPDRVESKEIVQSLGTSNYLTREYERKEADASGRRSRVQLHAAYYTGDIETVPHVPEVCFVGGGWQQVGGPWIVEVPLDTSSWRADGSVPAALAGDAGVLYAVRPDPAYSDYTGSAGVRMPRGVGPGSPPRMAVSEFLWTDGRARLFSGYFFVANGGTVARAEGVRALAFDLTSTHAYYLKVQVNSSGVGSAEELAAESAGLIGELLPEIMRCVPDWVEVQEGRYPGGDGGGGG